MRVLVAPVSGGTFPTQLNTIISIGDRYDVAMASSGGNVATYIAMASSFTRCGSEDIARMLSSKLFISSWWPHPFSSVFPSWSLSYLHGTLYNHGIGAEGIFDQIFTSTTIGSLEVWTGTLNITKGRAEFFSNLTFEESCLQLNAFRGTSLNSVPLRYMNRNKKLIAQVSYASAAIPLIIPSVKVGNCHYADGGTAFSSPLTPLQDTIVPCSTYRCYWPSESVHIDYLSGYNLEADGRLISYRSFLENSEVTLDELVKSLEIQDRLTGIKLVNPQYYEEGEVEKYTLLDLERKRRDCSKSLLEVYPRKKIEISLENFKGEDVVEAMDKSREVLSYRLWYS